MSIEKYFEEYNTPGVQDAMEASVDSQINCISLYLKKFISDNPNGGTIVDIGCGNGIIFDRLLSYSEFVDNSQFIYFGTDEISKLKVINDRALEHRFSRRVELHDLDEFYTESLSKFNLPSPMLFVCRNVFHELTISETAKLLYYLKLNLNDNKIIIQDLLNFKQGECGNVCWNFALFEKMLKDIGFEGIFDLQESKSKSAWFSSIVENKSNKLTENEIEKFVLEARQEQYDELVKNYKNGVRNDNQILVIDEHIQLAALSVQLSCYGKENKLPYEDSYSIKAILENVLSQYDLSSVPNNSVDRPYDFRDRAKAQDKIEEMLKNEQCRFQVLGGMKIGKNYLIKQVLSHRAFDRNTIFVDIYKSTNIWNIIEQLFEGMCIHLKQEIVSDLCKITYNDIKEKLKEVLEVVGDHTILVFRHFENCLDENYYITNKEIRQFIKDVVCSKVSCIIFSSRKGCLNDFFDGIDKINVSVFPEDHHVINVLDDYIDRRGKKNIEYPQELIEAIGRHPYLTYFTAKVISKQGIDRLHDKEFINEVKNKMWNELSKRLIDEKTKNIVNFLHVLRIPTPIYEISNIFLTDEIELAISDGIVSKTYKYNEELISVSNFIEIDKTESEGSVINDEMLKTICSIYEKSYKRTKNPIWLREYFYFSACLKSNKNIIFGNIYFNDIREAANFWYKSKKEYALSLWACRKLQEMGDKTDETNILMACCLFRIKGEKEIKVGTKIFERIIDNHPKIHVYKTKYIDSLIYISDYNKALHLLKEYGYDNSSNFWNSIEYAKVYMGLHDYGQAIQSFKNALYFEQDVRTYINLSMCYYKKGDFNNELRTLEKAYFVSKEIYVVKNYTSALMRSGNKDNISLAGEILSNYYKTDFDILTLYCKYLCRNSNAQKARNLVNSFEANMLDVGIKRKIFMEIYMAEDKLERCLEIVKEMDITPSKRDMLYKRIYLYFARKKNSSPIALKGLKIKIPKEYQSDIPLHLTHLSLATFAGRNDIIGSERRIIMELNDKFDIDKFDFEIDMSDDNYTE